MPAPDFVRNLVKGEHPIYTRRKADWERDEARYRGGRHVHGELMPFSWEVEDQDRIGTRLRDVMLKAGEEAAQALLEATLSTDTAVHPHLLQRQQTATYLKWPQRMAERFVGRLAADAPKPGEGGGYRFGQLGTVRDEEKRTDTPERAELLWDDADGQGTAFLSWMNDVQQWAMVTGHRWVGVAAPAAPSGRGGGRAATLQDEIEGQRPYLVHYSPLHVPNWTIGADGRPDFLVIRLMRRTLVDAQGDYAGDKMEPYRLLYVRRGYGLLGPDYAAGGWWRFNDDGEADDERHGPSSGPLPTEDGLIPYTPFFYERDARDFSRSGTSEIGSVAVSYMSISSAGDNDAIEGGGRTLFLLGISEQAFKDVVDTKSKGSRLVPVLSDTFEEKGGTPQIYDSAAASASEGIETALARKVREAAMIAQDELNTSPDASGKARQVDFAASQVPRLALMAYNREQAERELLRHVQRVWGFTPDASVTWKKTYDLDLTADDWMALLDAADRSMVRSPTLTLAALKGLAEEKGLPIKTATWAKIEAEMEAADEREAQARQADALTDGDPDPDDEEGGEA